MLYYKNLFFSITGIISTVYFYLEYDSLVKENINLKKDKIYLISIINKSKNYIETLNNNIIEDTQICENNNIIEDTQICENNDTLQLEIEQKCFDTATEDLYNSNSYWI